MPYTLTEALIAACTLLLTALIGSFSQPAIHILWDMLTLNQRRTAVTGVATAMYRRNQRGVQRATT